MVKWILAVDDEPDVLSILEDEILGAAPKCKFEKATTYEEAAKKLESQTMMWLSSTSWAFGGSTYWNWQ